MSFNQMIEMLQLNEAYFGKNKYLEDCDKRFENIKREMQKTNVAGVIGSYVMTENMLDEIGKVEENVKKLFNLKGVAINLMSLISANAFAFNDFSGLKLIKDITKKNETEITELGVRLKNNNSKVIYIILGSELLTVSDLTGAEMTALMLHEIGHNFYYDDSGFSMLKSSMYFAYTLNNFRKVLAKVKDANILNSLSALPLNDIGYKMDRIFKDSEFGKGMYRAINTFGSMGSMYGSIMVTMQQPFLIFKRFPFKIFDKIKGMIMPDSIDSFKNEEFSDDFVSSYGYSKELISALGKTSINKSASSKLPVVKVIEDFNNACLMIENYWISPYPTELERMERQISYLETQLSFIKEPRIRKLIHEDIKNAKKQITATERKVLYNKATEAKIFTGALFGFFKYIDPKKYIPGYSRFKKEHRQLKNK